MLLNAWYIIQSVSKMLGSRAGNPASLSDSVNSFLSSVINKYSGQGQALLIQGNQVGYSASY